MALLEAPNPLVDLRRLLQLSLLEPPSQGFQIGHQSLLMHLPDRAIFLLSPCTQTPDIHFVAVLPPLDLDP